MSEEKTQNQAMIRQKYTDEFKAEAVRMVLEKNVSVAQVSRELRMTEKLLGRWVREQRAKNGTLIETERQELTRLRREIKRLAEDNELLKKAALLLGSRTR